MTAQKLWQKQLDHVAKTGGYWIPQNAIDNDLNREIMKAFKQEYGEAYIGFVNLPEDKLQELQTGESIAVYEEYTGQKVFDFGCDFIVPKKDSLLESLILQWNKTERALRGEKLMNCIFFRIKQLKGFNLIWS